MKKKKDKAETTISGTFIHQICKRLAEGKRVRRTLPSGGRLHIDRTLPFLVVYRSRPKISDNGTDLLVKGEASYLIAPGNRRFKPGLARLVHSVVETLTSKCGAFLIIEIWSGDGLVDKDEAPALTKPAFQVVLPASSSLSGTAEALAKALRKTRVRKESATVELLYINNPSPPGLGALVPAKTAEKLSCSVLGLEIRPFYRHPGSGEVFPLMLRRLHLGLSRALKQAVFEFSHNQTAVRPAHYHSLGRRAMVRAVWDVDRRVADISSQFDFLLLLTPVNMEAEWLKFRRGHGEKPPGFHYRPRLVDPASLKRELYQIPVEHVEDPVLAALFREKRTEIDRQLTMIQDRDTKKLLYGSLQLFSSVDEKLFRLSKKLLKVFPPHSHDDSRGGYMDADTFADRARNELEYYRQTDPSISGSVEIRADIVGLMVSRGKLLVSRNSRIPLSRVEALIQHEVGTHLVTYFNGRAQPFRQLYCGLAGYEELQEGLGVLSEYLTGGLSRPRLRLLAGRVVAVKCLIDGASFIDTYRVLNRECGFEQRTAFTMTARVYRGGGLTKDAVYLRGLVNLLTYLGEGGEIEPLLVGKIATLHVPIVKELQWRQVLQPAPLRPRYLDLPGTAEKLKKVRDGCTVLDLIERRKK